MLRKKREKITWVVSSNTFQRPHCIADLYQLIKLFQIEANSITDKEEDQVAIHLIVKLA